MLKGGGAAADPTGRNRDSFEPGGTQPGGTQGPNAAAPTQAPANGSTVDKMLAEARSHVGYREGAGNKNKFSTAMGRPAEAWCADFVSYVAKQAGAKTVNTASAQGIADQLAKQGRWKGRSNPQPGDAVTFNWSGSGGRANHVGIVESVFQKNGQTYIRTIEGNSGDAVRYREYPANSRVINGFGRIA
jgi:cell wall-associated NlpC family hydrolase